MIRAIARTQLLSYGSLALPLAFAGMPLYIHAPDFYATHHGLALTQIGIILLIVRGLDAVQDPLIGVLSDRYARYRAGIIAIAMGVLGAGFYLLFHPPEPATAIWFTMSVMLTTLAFSVLTINLNTLGSLWSSDSLEQTRITTTREAIGLCGLMLVSIVPTILQRHETAGVAFDQLTWLLFMLIAISGFLFLRWIKRHKNILEHHAAATNHMALWQCLKEQQPFYAIYGINALASSIPSVLVLFFIRDRLNAQTCSGVFLLLYFIAGVMGMPLWQRLAARFGKMQCWMSSMGLAIASFLWAALLSSGDVVAYGLICIVSGLALGAELALPPSILADTINHKGSQSHASMQFSVLAFMSKAALALAAGICLPLLQASGYHSGGDNSAQALQSLGFTYALLPCLLKMVAAAMLWHFIKHHAKGLVYEETIDGRMPAGGHNAVV